MNVRLAFSVASSNEGFRLAPFWQPMRTVKIMQAQATRKEWVTLQIRNLLVVMLAMLTDDLGFILTEFN